MKFNYDLFSVGWASVLLEINSKEIYIDPSYVTEPLGDLVKSLMKLMPECTPEDEVVDQSTFEWDSEPAVHKWFFKRSQDTLRVQIIEYLDGNIGEKGNLVFDEECNLQDFINEVVLSLEEMLRKYGLVGYQANWYRFDFPISGYFRLKHYLLHRGKFPSEIFNKNTDEYDYKKSDFVYELKLLGKIVKDLER